MRVKTPVSFIPRPFLFPVLIPFSLHDHLPHHSPHHFHLPFPFPFPITLPSTIHLQPPKIHPKNLPFITKSPCFVSRYLDPTSPRLRDPQILHLRPRPAHGGDYAQSGQDVERMGVEYWEEEEGCWRRRRWWWWKRRERVREDLRDELIKL